MHEKKDIWKTDGIGIGRGYGIVGLRVGETPVHRQRIQRRRHQLHPVRKHRQRKKQSPLDGQTLLQRIAAISGLWIHRWVWIHHLQR